MNEAAPTPLDIVEPDIDRLRQQIEALLAALGSAVERTDYDQDARRRAIGGAGHHFKTALGFVKNASWQRDRS